MNSARFAKVAKVFALSVALSTGLAVTVLHTPADEVHAQEASLDNDTQSNVDAAVAEFNRGNYEKSSELFNKVMLGMPSDPAAGKAYITGVRAAVPNDIQRSLNRIEILPNIAKASTVLKSVGVWMVSGRVPSANRKDMIFGRLFADTDKLNQFVKSYMLEEDPLLRVSRGRAIAKNYGEFAVAPIFNTYLATLAAGNDNNRTNIARAQALLVAMGAQATMPLVQTFNYSGEHRDLVLTPVVRVLGELGANIALPALREEAEKKSNSAAFKNLCNVAISTILDLDASPDTRSDQRVTADAQTMWYLQANGWYLNDAVGGFGPTYNKLIGTNFAGHLPSVTDSYGEKYALWEYSADGGLSFDVTPSWAYADRLAAYAAEKAAGLALANAESRGFSEAYDDPFVLNAVSLQARVMFHQYAAADGRMKRLKIDSDSSDVSAEQELIDAVMRDASGLLKTGHMAGLASVFGPRVLMNALRMSLGEGYSQVSVAICDALLEVHSMGNIYTDYLPTEPEAGRIEIEDEDGDGHEGPEGESGMDTEEGEDAESDGEMEVEEEEVESAEEAEKRRHAEYLESIEQSKRDFLAPLIAAAQNDHERVRYAAARAMVGLAYDLDYPESGKVLSAFNTALQQSSMKNILVIATNPATRSAVRDAIRSHTTYSVVTFDKVEAGLRQITQSPIYDAVIIATEDAASAVDVYVPGARNTSTGNGQSTAVETALGVLRADVGTRNIPRIYIGSSSDLAGYGADDASFVESAKSADEIRGRLSSAIGDETGEDESNAFVIRACEVIRSFDPNDAKLNMNVIASSLAASLGAPDGKDASGVNASTGRSARSTGARIALADALAHLGTYEDYSFNSGELVVGNLVSILNTFDGEDQKDTAAVRASCAQALGETMRIHKDREGFQGTHDAVRSALMATMNMEGSEGNAQENMDTRRARHVAGTNLGKLNLTAMERHNLAKALRTANFMPKNK